VAKGKKNPFKGRQFTAEVILWAVRWYLQCPTSYRDLESMLADVAFRSITRPCFAGFKPMHPSWTSASVHITA
jgi:hypothetical protein